MQENIGADGPGRVSAMRQQDLVQQELRLSSGQPTPCAQAACDVKHRHDRKLQPLRILQTELHVTRRRQILISMTPRDRPGISQILEELLPVAYLKLGLCRSESMMSGH